MPSFSTLSGFEAYVKKQMESVLRNEVSKKGEELLKDAIDKKVYSRPANEYVRTFDLLNSSDSLFESSSIIQTVSIFNNTSNMPSGHPSWVDNSNQNQNIPIWMEFGTSSPLYSHLATGYFAFMVQRMDKEFKKTVISGLRKRGIIAK